MQENIIMSRKLNPNRPRYAAMIGDARRAKGWTQAQLAENVGLEETTIRKYESGQRTPGFDELYNLCSVLNLDIYDVMDMDLKHNESTNYIEYVDKPYKKILALLDDSISVANLADSGYTDNDIAVYYNDNETITTKTELILQAAAIRKQLQVEYKTRLTEEINRLVKNATNK